MISDFNLLSSSPTCLSKNNSHNFDEQIYINEEQLLFFNNQMPNDYQTSSSKNDETISYVSSKLNKELYEFKLLNETEAAVIIQKAYRNFKQRRKGFLGQGKINQEEMSNYIGFWDDGMVNGQSASSLNTISNSASDSKNSCDFDNKEEYKEDYIYNPTEFRNNQIYDYIPCKSLLSSPLDLPNKILAMPQFLQDRHFLYPLTKPPQKSTDLLRFNSQSGNSTQSNNPLIVPFKKSLENERFNMVQSFEKSLIFRTTDHNCTKHKVYRNNSICCTDYSRITSTNNNDLQSKHYCCSRQPEEIQRFNLLHKQSEVIRNQKMVTTKRMYRVGLNIFNKDPILGINYLLKYQYIKDNPTYIANFLLTKSGICYSSVGDYLGSINNPLALEVTKCFLRRINMKNKDVDEALRSFIHYVHLPGESQKICHLMEEFKSAYIQQNGMRTLFKSQETIMILGYAVIMLHTDCHNQSIRKNDKMSKEQFVNNLRGVDENSDIDRGILERIYIRVTKKEIKTQPDHTDHVRQLNDVIIGSIKPNNFVDRTRRFICYCRLSEIKDDTKKYKSGAHQREVFLFNDILLITKINTKSRKEDVRYQCKYSLSLVDLRVKLFISNNYKFGIHLFDRKNDDSILKFNAKSEIDQKKFMFDLNDCIFESLEMAKINFSTSLSCSRTFKDLHNNIAPKDSLLFPDLIPNTPSRKESLRTMVQPDDIQSSLIAPQFSSEYEYAQLRKMNNKH